MFTSPFVKRQSEALSAHESGQAADLHLQNRNPQCDSIVGTPPRVGETVYMLFHPDFNRRPWSLTRSADTLKEGRSRAIPPVGTFTPP